LQKFHVPRLARKFHWKRCAFLDVASVRVVVLFGIRTSKVEVNSSVAVFGRGAVGLAVIQGAQKVGACCIIAVDINPAKLAMAEELGATDKVDYSKLDKPVQQYSAGDLTPWGVDYTFDYTGNTNVTRAALTCARRGWRNVLFDGSGRHKVTEFRFVPFR
jgi:Zn-dependent alcohol dehydrogenase